MLEIILVIADHVVFVCTSNLNDVQITRHQFYNGLYINLFIDVGNFTLDIYASTNKTNRETFFLTSSKLFIRRNSSAECKTNVSAFLSFYMRGIFVIFIKICFN